MAFGIACHHDERNNRDPAPNPKEEKRHIATWIALASAVVAIIAAIISGEQVDVAEQQNMAAEQQQLVTITTSIAAQLAGEQTAENQAAGNLTGTARSIAISNAGMGNAPPHNVPTRADALRNEAALLYSLGQSATAHQDMMRAVRIYSGPLELTKSDIDNAVAQAYLGDAGYQIEISCRVAAADMADAQHAVAPLGTNGANAAIQALTGTDEAVYQKRCPPVSTSQPSSHPASQPSSQPASPSASPTGPQLTMGQSKSVPLGFAGFDEIGTATLTLSGAQVTTQPDTSGNPPANGFYVYVHVEATVTNGQFALIPDTDFYAVVNGTHYEKDDNVSSSFAPGTLTTGQTTSGEIAFDIPAQHGTIVYAPTMAGSAPIAVWSF